MKLTFLNSLGKKFLAFKRIFAILLSGQRVQVLNNCYLFYSSKITFFTTFLTNKKTMTFACIRSTLSNNFNCQSGVFT